MPFLWFPTLTESIELILGEIRIEETCDKTPESEKILTIIDSIFYCFIPFLITLLFSALTVKKMIQVKKFYYNKRCKIKKSMGETKELKPQSQTNDKDELFRCKRSVSLNCSEPEFLLARYMGKRGSLPVFIDNTISYNNHFYFMKKNTSNLQIVQTFSSRKRLNNFKISFLLMIFPFCFLLTNLPIILIIVFKMFNSFFKLERNLLVEFTIAKSLMYLNNSINILLLLAFSKRFRSNFLKTFFTRNI